MLCPSHRGNRYSPSVGNCQNCPSMTPNRQFKLCSRCSVRLNQCQVCRQPASGSGPTSVKPDDPTQK